MLCQRALRSIHRRYSPSWAEDQGGMAILTGSAIRMTRIFKSIEQWASESDDRVRLLIILIWAALGVIVLLAMLMAAWIMLPSDFRLF